MSVNRTAAIPNPFPLKESLRRGIVAIGNFDGVHRGHQAMMAKLRDRARQAGGPAIALTFEPHPISLLRPEQAPPSISTLDRRIELLHQAGADHVLVYPTHRQFLELTAEQFFRGIVCEELQARGLVEGPNFFFGKNREANITLLQGFCRESGLSLDVVPPVLVDGQLVSSSVIRSLIGQGNLSAAVELMGHPLRLTGVVAPGAQRGRTIGFPTANLTGIATVLPPHGVYAGRCEVDGKTYAAAVNLGPNPTFSEQSTKLEAHFLDFPSGIDLYGRTLQLDLHHRLRDVRKFASVAELIEQLHRDIAATRLKHTSGSM